MPITVTHCSSFLAHIVTKQRLLRNAAKCQGAAIAQLGLYSGSARTSGKPVKYVASWNSPPGTLIVLTTGHKIFE